MYQENTFPPGHNGAKRSVRCPVNSCGSTFKRKSGFPTLRRFDNVCAL